MEFINSHQIRADLLDQESFDIFIVAAGYERRCTWLIENHHIKAEYKLALAFVEKHNKLNRKSNNRIFENNGFSFMDISGEDYFILEQFLTDLLRKINKDFVKILVDYSCMTKLWYAAIINLLTHDEDHFQRVNVWFSYTPAEFGKIKKPGLSKKISSLSLGEKSFDPKKPTALILGLGIEKGVSEYVYHKLKPDVCYLLYADPAPDQNYVKEVFDNNQQIINSIDVRNFINYPLNDLNKSVEILTNLSLELRLKYNVILASLGPKVFSLNCILIATRFPDMEVWRVTSGQNFNVVDRLPFGEPLVLEVDFSNEEDDY